jgi:hypothetical protein
MGKRFLSARQIIILKKDRIDQLIKERSKEGKT